jgi:cobalt/nickel transport system permease protein
MEGFLPPVMSLLWTLAAVPFILLGIRSIQKIVAVNPRAKLMLAMAGAFVFILSALKLPSVTGSCSHPTGVGFGTLILGPLAMSVLGLIVLLFQALLLAHGGLTTLGANVFSMAVVGPFVAFGVYTLCMRFKVSRSVSIFAAAALGNLLTYAMTSFQLGLAFPDPTGGLWVSVAKFMGIFVWTQLPLAISEGILTVLMFRALEALGTEDLRTMTFFSKEAQHE